MSKNSPVAIFLAASAILSAGTLTANSTFAGEKLEGGFKEWTTDQGVNEDGKLDEDAKKAAKKNKKKNVCIPIGEGENCW